MRIGSRAAPSREKAFSQARATEQDFGAGIGTAVQRLGDSIGEYGISKAQLDNVLREKRKGNQRASLDIGMTRWEEEQKRRIMDESLNVTPGAEGFTDQVFTSINSSWEEFKKAQNIPEELADEYEQRFVTFQERATTTAFAKELEESDRLIIELVNEQLDVMAQDVNINNQNFTSHFEQISRVIDESGLPPTSKVEAKQTAYNRLASSLFESERVQAQRDQLPVREPDGSDVVAPGLSPGRRGLLNAITAFESPGGIYNSRFNGRGGAPATFDDYSDHPRIFVPTGRTNADGTPEMSSAAGRYQFTATTWDWVMRSMQAEGYEMDGTFSPVNQDRAAAWYAAYKYRRATGRDLDAVLNSGNREELRQVFESLKGTWEGLQEAYGGNFDKFANTILGVKGLNGGGTGSSTVPDVWNDPRYAALSYEQKITLDGQAADTARQQREARKLELERREQEVYDNLLKAFATGEEAALDAADAAIAAGRISDAAKIEKLMKLGETEREERGQVADVIGAVSLGRTLGPDDKDALNVYARRTGLTDGIRGGSADAIMQLNGVYEKTGAIPSDVLDVLDKQLAHPDINQRMFALQTLADLYAGNSDAALRNMSEKQAEKAALASTIIQNSPDPQAALAQYSLLTAPENAEVRRRLSDQADKFMEESSPSEFFNNATTFMQRHFSFVAGVPNPSLPTTPMENMLFTSDYERLFKQYYINFQGDEDMAHEAAGKVMSYKWQPSPLTGELMKYSPVSPQFGLQPINGSYDWIDRSVREQMGFGPDDQFTIVADAGTLRDFQSSGAPSYTVVQNVEGFMTVLPAGRVSIQITEEMRAENEQAQALSNLEQRKAGLVTQLRKAESLFGRYERSPYGGFTRSEDQTPALRAEIERVNREIEAMRQSGPLPQALQETTAAPATSPNPPQRPQQIGPSEEELRAEMNRLSRINTPEARREMQQAQEQLRRLRSAQ